VLSPRRRVDTHPLAIDGRIFAHNGVLRGLDRLEVELGEDRALVQGETDSERYFALITREIRANGGDVGAGIAAARWIAENLPAYSINCLLATEHQLWALRYPETHDLRPGSRTAGAVGSRIMQVLAAFDCRAACTTDRRGSIRRG
jgi:glutamine amidotransferase